MVGLTGRRVLDDLLRFRESKGELVDDTEHLRDAYVFAEKQKTLPRIDKLGMLLELPPILLELPPDFEVFYNEKIYRVSALKARLEGQIERQKRGRYKLWETAEILANALQSTSGLDAQARSIATRMKEAFKNGGLRFYDSTTIGIDPKGYFGDFLDYPDSTENFTTPKEVNEWLERTGSLLRFPEEAGTPTAAVADVLALQTSPKVMPSAPAKRVLACEIQDAAILAAIREAGHNPLALPKWKNNTPGVKAQVRELLIGKHSAFPNNGTQFRHAWDRLRLREEIADA